MSRLGQQKFLVRKYGVNVASTMCFFGEKAKRQQKGFICAKAKQQSQQQGACGGK
ncbi:hypothetical protein [Lysinibacillus xylanilyticus]|uniref:hypothetical protein n=1 Tax=Lysinibacillus xylanilyticus TaxID=582475 RepID=UPI003CFECB80